MNDQTPVRRLTQAKYRICIRYSVSIALAVLMKMIVNLLRQRL